MSMINFKGLASLTLTLFSTSMIYAAKPNCCNQKNTVTKGFDQKTLTESLSTYKKFENILYKFGTNCVGLPTEYILYKGIYGSLKWLVKNLLIKPGYIGKRATDSMCHSLSKDEDFKEIISGLQGAQKYRIILPIAIAIPLIKHFYFKSSSWGLNRTNTVMYGILLSTLIGLLEYDYLKDQQKQKAENQLELTGAQELTTISENSEISPIVTGQEAIVFTPGSIEEPPLQEQTTENTQVVTEDEPAQTSQEEPTPQPNAQFSQDESPVTLPAQENKDSDEENPTT